MHKCLLIPFMTLRQAVDNQKGTMIQVIPNGPVKVSGPCEVALPNGETTTSERDVFLCRCGASANKPYCDGTHKKFSNDLVGKEGPGVEARADEQPTIRTYGDVDP